MTGLRFDHAIIRVFDLDEASEDFRALGFTVVYGGKHAGGKTHNALIVLPDSTYLELMAPTDPALLTFVNPADRSSYLFIFANNAGEGPAGYALCSDELENEVEVLRSRGIEVELHPPGGRARPDGQQLLWRLATMGASMLPFFIQDETPRVLRIPDDADKTTHSNGATGTAGLTVQVPALAAGMERYRAILGIEPIRHEGAHAEFSFGNFIVTVAENSGLEHDRLAGVRLKADQAHVLDPAKTHGARIELVE